MEQTGVTTGSERRRLRALVTPLAWAASAITLVFALAETAASGAFSAATGTDSSRVSAAADFCSAPNSQTMAATADTTINQGAANVAPSATDIRMRVTSRTGSPNPTNIRGLVRFALPTVPAGCTISSAWLRLYNVLPVSGRIIDVHRIDATAPLWVEGAVTWNTRPGVVAGTAVGRPSPAAEGWMEWDVTAQVPSLYSGNNNGFMVQDRVEDDLVGVEQSFVSRDTSTGPYAATLPALVVTWS